MYIYTHWIIYNFPKWLTMNLRSRTCSPIMMISFTYIWNIFGMNMFTILYPVLLVMTSYHYNIVYHQLPLLLLLLIMCCYDYHISFFHMRVSSNRDTQKWIVHIANTINMDDLGVPRFPETEKYHQHEFTNNRFLLTLWTIYHYYICI